MIDVMLNVNDHRNGMATGWIESVHIDDLIQLDGPCTGDDDEDEAIDLDGLTLFSADGTTVAIGGVTFRHHGYRTWVGNWCWDMVRMEPAEALRLLNHLKALEWHCEEAESSLFERWRQPGDLAMEDLTRAGLKVALDSGRTRR